MKQTAPIDAVRGVVAGGREAQGTLLINFAVAALFSATFAASLSAQLNPALSISKTHTGNFTQGQTGATYAVTVSNAAGAGPTSGAVTVTETAPSGLTLASMAGTGWTCLSGGNTCTRDDSLAAGASYPAITVTVDVAGNAASPQVNAVGVSGGGSVSANATDPTAVGPTVTYMVGDVAPFTADTAPGFGDGNLNILDLVQVVFAVNNVPGFRPAACSDRFDAMDLYPADGVSTRGGDGALDIRDLIVELFRVNNLDLDRPLRATRICASPTAAYPFEEGSGTLVADASGHGITGAIQGATWTAAGKYGRALSFDGESSYVDLGDQSLLQITGSMTWSAWVYATGNPPDDGQIIAKSDSDAGRTGWQFKTTPDSGSRTFGVAVSSDGASFAQRCSNTIPALNTWYYVAGVYNAAARTLDIYVNGAPDNGVLFGTVPASQFSPNVNVNIGRRSGGFYFQGIIDEVRIYGRALSQAEILRDMNSPVGSAFDTQAPTAPGSLTATAASGTQINLAWTASTDNVAVTGYHVERCQGAGCGSFAQIAAPTGTTFSDTALTPNTVYNYQVRAVDWAGNLSAYSNVASATTFPPDVTPPTTPTNLTATPINASQINLTWSASTDNVGVAGYTVFRNGSPVGVTVASFSADRGLSANTAYTFAVSAFDGAGNVSGVSQPATATTSSGPYTPAYPLKTSATGRYLVDQNDVPFLIVGDSPQAVIGVRSLADAGSYFADRQSLGFNSLWINLLCADYTACESNGATYDGIAPFTGGASPADYDLSTPNESYFAKVDAVLALASSYGLVVFLDPIETGSWLQTLQANGASKAHDYGEYLGNRYKTYPNIVWLNGNDFQTWRTAGDDALVLAVAQGIRSADPNHIQTVELDYSVSSSLDDSNWAPLISLNAAYTYFPTYAEVLHAYNQSSSVPVFLVEEHYELEEVGGEFGTPNVLRRQEYWTMLSGATGQLYGSYFTWEAIWGGLSDLDTPGALQLGYMKNLFAPRAWYNLIPDQDHTVVTGGFGVFSSDGNVSDSDYLTAARTPDGSLVMAYMPTARSITVDLTKLAGPARAQWYDPSNGVYYPVSGSPFSNIGAQLFAPPGNNSAGDGDWVLVLESN